jgi:hypothetical protein
VPVLVLSRRHSPDSNAMWRAAVDARWDVVRAMGYEPPPELAGRKDVVFYGETLLADAIAPPLDLVLLEPDARWLAAVPERHLRRRVRAGCVADVRTRAERAFVKPADEKVFPARVYEAAEPIDAEHALDDQLAVLVSEPVRFGVEVRAFVRERRIASMSAYVRDGEIARDSSGEWPLSDDEREGACALLEAMCADPEVALPPGVVLDVGRIEDGGWALVEANAAWASGICGCDPAAVLETVALTTMPRAVLTSDLRRWARTPALELE